MSFVHIPLVEETFNCNIYVLDLDNPHILGSKLNVWETMLYKSHTRANANKYWLLFGGDHYHSINNIEGYLSVKHFCNKCFSCFSHTNAYVNHKCSFCKDKRRPNRKIMNHNKNKDLAHYLRSKFCKGSIEELNAKLEDVYDVARIEDIKYKHNHPRYITFDFETDTSSPGHIHAPNHVEVDILMVDDEKTHEYDECLTDQLSFTGYGCEKYFL